MDCIVSKGSEHHTMNSRDRLKFYFAEHAAGNLQLLCPKCHVKKTLDEIAARQFHEYRAACPACGHQFRVSDEMRSPALLQAAQGKSVAEAQILPPSL
jgi:transcription initiation factor IIE alpha subunit